nr:MAG TPA: hypothetical protein [Caudoviricetes sp.]
MTNLFDCIADNDARYFTHRGISCMNHMGPFTINGYVELPENHPWLNEGDLQDFNDVDVHGGISFHEGRVIGFDTNHLGDGHHPEAELADRDQLFPFQTYYGGDVHIWTWEEVEAETRKLADQVKEVHNA